MSKKIAVIGGDVRQVTVGRLLADDGFDVVMYGFDEKYMQNGLRPADSLQDACKDADYIILGMPACGEGAKINTPCSSRELYISDLTAAMDKNTVIIGGRLTDELTDACKYAGVLYADYLTREELAVCNAVPTAEGAVAIAMNELPFTLCGSKCLVAGYGRIGKILAKMLAGIGADVSCSARKHSDLAWIRANGYTPVAMKDLKPQIHKFPIIFNTIPHTVFDRDMLKNMQGDVLIIDLASKPGGVDFYAAQELGIKVIWALSLPGKVAPVTAGHIIKDTVINIINEL